MRPLTRKSTYKALALCGIVGATGLGIGATFGDKIFPPAQKAQPQTASLDLTHLRESDMASLIERKIETTTGLDVKTFYDSKKRGIYVQLGQDGDATYRIEITPENTKLTVALAYSGPKPVKTTWLDIVLDENGNFASAGYEGKTMSQVGPVSLDDPVIGEYLREELAKAQQRYGSRIKQVADAARYEEALQLNRF